MSRFCPLFSSSSGNCSFVGTSQHGLLVDVGCSHKRVLGALEQNMIDPAAIIGIAVTHEHGDHVCGLRTFLKKHRVPVIASPSTLKSLMACGKLCPDDPMIPICDDKVVLEDIAIQRVATSHDCDGSSGFVFSLPDERRVAVCTDLGYISDDIAAALEGCDLVMIESNHDINMLKNGPYPPQTKARILSDRGHLSNGACAALLPRLVKSGTTRIVLGHLSQNNNLPALALSTARAAMTDAGYREKCDYILYVAPVCNGRMFYL